MNLSVELIAVLAAIAIVVVTQLILNKLDRFWAELDKSFDQSSEEE